MDWTTTLAERDVYNRGMQYIDQRKYCTFKALLLHALCCGLASCSCKSQTAAEKRRQQA